MSAPRTEYRERAIASGLGVRCASNPAWVESAVALSFAGGDREDPADRSGLCELAGHLLTTGARRPRIEALYRRGLTVDRATSDVDTTFVAAGHRDLTLDALALFAGLFAAAPPAEAELAAEIEALGGAHAGEWRALRELRRLQRALAGDGAPERRFDTAQLRGLSPGDLAEHQARWLTPRNARLTLATPLPLDQAFAVVEERFGALAPGPPVTPRPFGDRIPAPALVVRPYPDRQALVATFHRHRVTAAELPATALASQLLGAGLLPALLEHEPGTYSPGARLSMVEGTGFVEHFVTTETGAALRALDRLLAHLDEVRGGALADDGATEMIARAHRASELLEASPAELCRYLAACWGGADQTWWELPPPRYREALAGLRPDDVRKILARLLAPGERTVLLTGNLPWCASRRARRVLQARS